MTLMYEYYDARDVTSSRVRTNAHDIREQRYWWSTNPSQKMAHVLTAQDEAEKLSRVWTVIHRADEIDGDDSAGLRH